MTTQTRPETKQERREIAAFRVRLNGSTARMTRRMKAFNRKYNRNQKEA